MPTIRNYLTSGPIMKVLRTYGITLVVLAVLLACETTVSNPGRFEDEFLNERNASQAMVNGAGRALSSGINWLSYRRGGYP